MVARCLARVFKRLPTSQAYSSHLSVTWGSLDAGPVLQTHKGCYGHGEGLISERGNKEAPRPKVFKITCSPSTVHDASQTYHWRRPVVPRIVHILQEAICIVAVTMQAVFTMKTIPWLPSAAISDLRLASGKSKNPPRLLGKNSYEIVRGSEPIMATPILKETDHFRRMHIDHLEWRNPVVFQETIDGRVGEGSTKDKASFQGASCRIDGFPMCKGAFIANDTCDECVLELDYAMSSGCSGLCKWFVRTVEVR